MMRSLRIIHLYLHSSICWLFLLARQRKVSLAIRSCYLSHQMNIVIPLTAEVASPFYSSSPQQHRGLVNVSPVFASFAFSQVLSPVELQWFQCNGPVVRASYVVVNFRYGLSVSSTVDRVCECLFIWCLVELNMFMFSGLSFHAWRPKWVWHRQLVQRSAATADGLATGFS